MFPCRRCARVKARWLLALLVLRAGREIRRDALASVLWPDSLPSDALTGLRQSLADLRKALGPEAVRLQSPTPRTLRLDTAGAKIDVLEFDRAIKRGDRHGLERAIELYRGPLLDGCAELWILPEREARRQAYLRAIEVSAAQAQADGAASEATALLRRGVQADPMREGLHRSLMQALADCGEYAEALQVYAALRNQLFEQQRMNPQAETIALYQRLRDIGRRIARPAPRYRTAQVEKAGDAPVEAAGNIPLPLTALIGRVEERRTLLTDLRVARLVSIIGTGGAGKTRFALHVANELQGAYRDGAWFVDLSPLTEAAGLAQAIAAALGLREERGREWNEILMATLSARQMLLVLDNCEHLATACAELARELLTHGPGLRLLTTSRQPLGLTGEVVLRLQGLSLPETGQSLGVVETADAARLFIERARAVRSDFALSESNRGAVAEICCLLDGLPLAIEMAAPLVESLTVVEIAARLKARLDLLVSDDPTRAARHQTLQAVVEWSYALLETAEQNLLRRLSVFAGGWMLDAAEAVCAGEEIEIWKITRTLGRLAAKSLVVAATQGEVTRYRLLETVKQEMIRRLEQAGEASETRRSHAAYYLRLAETAQEKLTGGEQAAWLEQLEAEHENFRAALQSEGMPACNALRLTCALGRFWQIRGYFGEGRAQIMQAITRAGGECPAAYRADALGWASLFATYQGNAAGEELARQALDLWEEAGDSSGKSAALGCLGVAAMNRGDYPAARAAFAQSLTAAREAQDNAGIASALGYMGIVAASEGNAVAAEAYFQESLTLRRQSGDVWGIAASLNNLGLLARQRQDRTQARTLLEESLRLRRRLQDSRSLAITLNLLGAVLCSLGEEAQGRPLLTEGLRLCWQNNDRRNLAYALEAFSLLFLRQKAPRQAALIWTAAERLRQQIGSPLSPVDIVTYERERAALAGLKAETAEKRQETGESVTLQQAAALCLTEEPTKTKVMRLIS